VGGRVERIGLATLYLGDCREIAPTLPRPAAVISDPPYGMAANTNSERFSGGAQDACRRAVHAFSGTGALGTKSLGRGRGKKWPAIIGDDASFGRA